MLIRFFFLQQHSRLSDYNFTITHFVNTLRNNSFQVTLAHRSQDPAGTSGLLPNTITNAVFNWKSGDNSVNAIDLANFDMIFLFGVASPTPDGSNCLCWDGGFQETQLWAFVQFMQAGGGIFATGDHEDLGAALCGSIPRVRSMRRWWWNDGGTPLKGPGGEGPYPGPSFYGMLYAIDARIDHDFNRDPYKIMGDICAPPALGPYRIDTLQGAPERVFDYWANGYQTGVSFDRQSDDVPQPLFLVPAGGGVIHPIFALGNDRYLDCLPDHMHEGMAIDLIDYYYEPGPKSQIFEHNGQSVPEYPSIELRSSVTLDRGSGKEYGQPNPQYRKGACRCTGPRLCSPARSYCRV